MITSMWIDLAKKGWGEVTPSFIICFKFSEDSGSKILSLCRRGNKDEILAKHLFIRDWVDQTDKASLGQEKGTKGDFTVQLANPESSRLRQTGWLHKCVWTQSPETGWLWLNLEEWQESSIFILARETVRACMNCTTSFSVSVVLSVKCCACNTRHRTSTDGVLRSQGPRQGWSTTAQEGGQTQDRAFRKDSCIWPGRHILTGATVQEGHVSYRD